MRHYIKTAIVLFLFVVGSTYAFCQDIIVTKKSEKIEAKITDVEQDVIKYKKFSYQEGPIYTIKKSEIASVIYQNGDVETFTEPVVSPNNAKVSNAVIKPGDFVNGYCTHVSVRSRALFGANTWYGAPSSNFNGYVIGEKVDGMSDMEIENKIRSGELAFFQDMDFKKYLEKYDTEAYRKLKQGQALQITGFVFATVGAVMAFSCSIVGLAANDSDYYLNVYLPVGCAGLAFAAAVGLPMVFSGAKICNKKVPEMYNNNISRSGYTASLNWRVGVVGNGVGFQLNF